MNPTQIATMLSLQDRLNSVINPAWVTAGYPWHRAIMVESTEALDHYGWKWWKAPPIQSAVQDQIQLELVDIWHFALSMVLDGSEGNQELALKSLTGYFEVLEKEPDAYGLVSGVEIPELFDVMIGASAQGVFHGAGFLELMKRFSLTWDGLYAMYVGKNVLNLFRRANGYKEGTYIKDWFGEGDNVVLARLMALTPDSSVEDLHANLQSVYDGVLAA